MILTVPAGFSRSSLRAASSASISSKRGPIVWSSRSPASVGETLRGASQEPQAEPFFQSPDGMAEGGLRNAELCRGSRETALSRDRQEGQEVV